MPALVAVDLFRIRLPLKRPFRTAHSITTRKDALLVRVVTDDAEGWGEVGAEVSPTYAPETLDSARIVLRDELIPRPFAGAPIDSVRGNHAARAALSTALLDARLRTEGVSLASHLGGRRSHVDAGVAIGRNDDLGELVAEVSEYLELGLPQLQAQDRARTRRRGGGRSGR